MSAERALARALDGSCQVPLAAYCTEEAGLLTLRGLVGHPDLPAFFCRPSLASTVMPIKLACAGAKAVDHPGIELIQSFLVEQPTQMSV